MLIIISVIITMSSLLFAASSTKFPKIAHSAAFSSNIAKGRYTKGSHPFLGGVEELHRCDLYHVKTVSKCACSSPYWK
jgi:hypothetical protein